jgi:DNA-binding MarR family transcriptional regulator
MPDERNERRQQHRKQAVEWTLAEIPAQLIRDMAQLRLEPTEFIFLAYLLAADVGWKEGKPVALPLRDVEQATGLSIGTIHKAKKGLIDKGFMAIVNVRNQARTNTYDLSPMRQRLDGRASIL